MASSLHETSQVLTSQPQLMRHGKITQEYYLQIPQDAAGCFLIALGTAAGFLSTCAAGLFIAMIGSALRPGFLFFPKWWTVDCLALVLAAAFPSLLLLPA